MPRFPLDVRYLLKRGAGVPQSAPQKITPREYSEVRKLCLLVAVLQLLLAVSLFAMERMPSSYFLAAVFSASLVVLVGYLTYRLLIPRRHLGLWLAVLVVTCAGQSLVWMEYWLLEASPDPGWSHVGVGLVISLLLAPLAYRFTWLLAGVVLTGGTTWLINPGETQLTASLMLLAAILGMGALVSRLIAAKRDAEWLSEDVVRRLAQSKAESADQQARIQYEREQRTQLEQDLLAVREVADSAAHAKTEFLATISHEIRTPLNGILPILEILQQSKLDEEQQRYVSTAFSSSHHLLRIINDILDFARAESGKLTLESIEFDLHEMVDSVVELMRSSALNKGLRVSLEVSSKVPKVLRGDPVRIRQVLTNLLSNAVKFTDAGEIRIAVTVRRASRKEVELMFVVIDSGMGMSRETSRKVFDSFTQADASTTRKHGGTGLGLVICKRLVELMGGHIGVRSRLGQGSEFWFLLPMRRSTQDVPSSRKNLDGVRLLWLIGDKQAAKLAESQFQAWGMLAEQAGLEDVISRLHTAAMLGHSWAYEVLLIDSWGIELRLAKLLAELRADPLLKGLPVIVASRSEEVAERMHREFSVYTLSGGINTAPLQRCLHRLFDVEAEAGGDAEEKSTAFRDLNLEQEIALQEFSPDMPATNSQYLSGQVLLVEDNPVNLGVVRRVLDRLGVGTIVAQNGREALEQLQGQSVDLVFMDCQMPVMDGYEATRQWREIEMQHQGKHLPVVAMTANAMQGDREKCLNAGMDDYLPKPVSIAGLQQMLEKWAPQCLASASQQNVPAYSPETAEKEAIVDKRVLAELREVMEEEFQTLVGTYLHNTPGLLRQIAQAVADQDLPALVLPAHSLKSSSANLGAMQMSDLARSLETAARENDLSTVSQLHPKVASVFTQTRQQLQAELRGA